MNGVLLTALGAAVGAPARYLVDRGMRRWLGERFPWGTLVVNVVGSLVLGGVVAAAGPDLRVLLGTGFCGALTTFSTFSADTLRLVESARRGAGAVYVGVSLVAGIGAFWLGLVCLG
ncbi:fluoride efflux transporter CrcB [Actinokineospora auranticolor]|uniref:Fluoride-specific ion channel FluC n=1 Tax=Actinokineospora auranticolor TaxID=155976 RepID=A0A2S6GMB8_9PSEU|nr:fluoride efflux transporter CrcB [Actinokineospora auranticolor]PPK66378.1 CrcB protein [Actinokineospora auranticolor]